MFAQLFTEALFVTARLEKTQIISGIGDGVHGMGGCSYKKEGEGPLYNTTQWLIKDVLLSGRSEWKKMRITWCHLSKTLCAYILKIHKHRKGTVQSLLTSGLRASHCPQQDQSQQARKPLPSPGGHSLVDINFYWRKLKSLEQQFYRQKKDASRSG